MYAMVTVDLPAMPAFGPMTLVDVQWWSPGSCSVLFGQALDGVRQEFGLAMDIDKGVFLDEPDDPVAADLLLRASPALRHVAMEAWRLWDGVSEHVTVPPSMGVDWTARVTHAVSAGVPT